MSQAAIERQLTTLIEDVKEGRRKHEEALNDVAMKVGEVAKIKGDVEILKQATQQIEADHKDFATSVQRQVTAARETAFDDRGNYRGIWGSESNARSFGLQMLAVLGGNIKCAEILKAEFPSYHERTIGSGAKAAIRAMGETDNLDGGALVPPEFMARLIRLVESFGIFEANAFQMPMSGDSLSFIRRKGGVTVFLVGENVAPTNTQPQYGNVELNAKEWGTLTFFPRSLEEDAAIPLAELIGVEIAYAFAQKADDCGMNGDGTSTYFGIKGVRQRLVDVYSTGGGLGLVQQSGTSGWTNIVRQDLLQVAGSAPELLGINSKWFVSRNFFWNVMANIILSAGGVTAGEMEGKRTLMFAGDPVQIAQIMPKTSAGTQVCALYGDLRLAATIGRRRAMAIEQSREYKFAERQVTVLGTQRIAINVHDVGDANLAGPIVGLITK